MPAIKKVSREAIVDAAVEVLRDGGFSTVNARSVASWAAQRSQFICPFKAWTR